MYFLASSATFALSATFPVPDVDDCHVFLLDDHTDTHLIVEHALPDSCVLTCCTTCAEARRALSTHLFDVLQIGLRLPDGPGVDMLRHARTHGSSRNTDPPAIAVTAQILLGKRGTLLHQEFDGCLSKPFFQREIVAAIRPHVSLS